MFLLHSKNTAVPVLMYHQIIGGRTDRRATPYAVSLNDFEAQLDFLKRNDFETLSLPELMCLSDSADSSKNRKYVSITFDDGYLDNYVDAFPALRKRNFCATFFVIVNRIGSSGFMTWEQLREMQQHGMSIQSHTMNHRPLAALYDDGVHVELHESRMLLAKQLGRPIDFISFPHGSYDERVLRAAAEAGYRAWCTSDFGYAHDVRHGSRIPRIVVRRNHSLPEFRGIVLAKGPRLMRLRAGAAVRRLIVRGIGSKNYQFLYDVYYRNRSAESSSAELMN